MHVTKKLTATAFAAAMALSLGLPAVAADFDVYAKRINTNKEVAEEKAPFEGELDFRSEERRVGKEC